MSELWGSMALRLANADILPIDVESYAGSVRDFVRRLDDIPGAAARLELPRLVEAVRGLRASGRRLNARVEQALAAGPLSRDVSARVNRGLRQFEQGWLHDEGIPGRPWFKHLLYAPRYTYAAMTLPGITEAAEQGDWTRAAAQLSLVVDAIARNTALADGVAAELPPDAQAGLPRVATAAACATAWTGAWPIYVENVATGERVAIDADSSVRDLQRDQGAADGRRARARAARAGCRCRTASRCRPSSGEFRRACSTRSIPGSRRRCATCSR